MKRVCRWFPIVVVVACGSPEVTETPVAGDPVAPDNGVDFGPTDVPDASDEDSGTTDGDGDATDVDGAEDVADDVEDTNSDDVADVAPPDDAGPADARVDADPPDTGPADTGPADTGPADTGPADAGSADTEPPDAAPVDLGTADVGPPDTGPEDTGPPDVCTAECAGKVCGAADGCGGTCQPGSGCCTDQCSPSGDTKCSGTKLQTCGDYDSDPCLEWSAPSACPGSQECSAGECKEPACFNQCAPGATMCASGSSVQACVDTDGDGCVEWAAPSACPSGTCSGGECTTAACVEPVGQIPAVGATGNGVCDWQHLLANDGQAAEFWGDSDDTWLQSGLPITTCRIVDFGSTCTPDAICVEAWVGQNGCSGDTCDGPCDPCKGFGGALDIFSNLTNSTSSYSFEFSMYIDDTSDPGKVQCYKFTDTPIRYVMVCRSSCSKTSANVFVDHVYLQ